MAARRSNLMRLPTGRVRYVGEPIAAIVAEDRYTANKARDLVEVTYEELPVVTNPREAIKPGSPLIEPEWGDNIMIHRDFVRGDIKAGLAGADGVVKGSVKAHRYVASPSNRVPMLPITNLWRHADSLVVDTESSPLAGVPGG